jgi:hypothetical protein
MELIELLTISLFCNALLLLREEGFPLCFIDKYIDKLCEKGHKWILIPYSPILGCVTCMSSLWGTLGYWYYVGFTMESFIELPITIIICAFLNTLIYEIFRYFREKA